MGKKTTVGLLIGGIMDEFNEMICRGVIAESEKDDINLVVIPVKYIEREMKNIPDLFEYQYITNEQSITSTNIDILIVIADCIGAFTTRANLVHFINTIKARNIPIILAASKIDGYPSVSFDNKTGITEGISYLVKEAGVHNICMLNSKEPNVDIKERYDAYIEMLDYYRLEHGPNSVLATNLTSEYTEDYERILDLNPNAEAIICANDNIAIALYSVMKRRGLTPGKEIKVMGFDNTKSANMITPSLTTVDADATHLGRRIFTMVRMMLEGWDVGETTIPTRFILRDSFGSLLDKENTDQTILDKQNLDEYFSRIFYKFDSKSYKENFELIIMFKTVMTIIIDYINSKDYSFERVNFLKQKVDEFFNLEPLKYTDVDVLLAYAERVQTAALNNFTNYERKCQAHETFSAIMERIVRTLFKAEDQDDKKDEYLFTLKSMVEEMLHHETYSDDDYSEITKSLSGFGIKNAYVYIYDTPVIHNNGEPFTVPEHLNIKTAMNDGVITNVPAEEQPITIDQIYDNKFITDKKAVMILMPLYFREKVFGSVLYDLTDISYEMGEYLANYYSIVAKIIDKYKN